MTMSMTGFGRGSTVETGRSFVIEIKSVNHRYLDLNIKMPKSLISLEDRIREVIKGRLKRGKVDVFVTQKIFERENVEAVLDKSLADSYIKCLHEIRDSYSLRDDISVTNIARFPDVISIEQKEEDFDEIWDIIKKPLNEALGAHIAMREREGKKLCEDIEKKCVNIKNLIYKVEERAPLVVDEYRNKLSERLKKLLDDSKYDENRVATEIAIFADKASIDEELVRLNSHILQMNETLKLKESVGRKLDFIVQEMNREANTIASKANDLTIVNTILNIKSEIEKIREQTQNVE